MSSDVMNQIIFNGSNYDLPPVFRYYSNKVGDDYNAVSGYVMQWPNGLQIITGYYEFENMIISNLTGKRGSLYESWKKDLPHYDAEFADAPCVIWVNDDRTNQYYFIGEITITGRARMGQCYVLSTNSNMMSKRACAMQFIAIGKWKVYEGDTYGSGKIDTTIKNEDKFAFGPIIEKRSVTNGSDFVIKFPNSNLMIIAGKRFQTSVPMTTAVEKMYVSDYTDFSNFSIPFAETPYIQLSINSGSTEGMIYGVTCSDTKFNVKYLSAVSKTNKVSVDFVAIGKIK